MNTSPPTERRGPKILTAQYFDDLDMACRREDINGMQAIRVIRRSYEALAARLSPEPRDDEVTRLLRDVALHPIACDRWTCAPDGDDYDPEKPCTCEIGAYLSTTKEGGQGALTCPVCGKRGCNCGSGSV